MYFQYITIINFPGVYFQYVTIISFAGVCFQYAILSMSQLCVFSMSLLSILQVCVFNTYADAAVCTDLHDLKSMLSDISGQEPVGPTLSGTGE